MPLNHSYRIFWILTVIFQQMEFLRYYELTFSKNEVPSLDVAYCNYIKILQLSNRLATVADLGGDPGVQRNPPFACKLAFVSTRARTYRLNYCSGNNNSIIYNITKTVYTTYSNAAVTHTSTAVCIILRHYALHNQ